eukprot:763889-Hanusia_phi.AAC.2
MRRRRRRRVRARVEKLSSGSWEEGLIRSDLEITVDTNKERAKSRLQQRARMTKLGMTGGLRRRRSWKRSLTT